LNSFFGLLFSIFLKFYVLNYVPKPSKDELSCGKAAEEMAELSGVLCFSLQKFQTNSKKQG